MVKDDGEEAKLLRCSNHDVIVIIIFISFYFYIKPTFYS